MFFAGYLGDKITLRLSKRRNGVHIPEDSLVSLIFPPIVCAIGIAVYAVSANDTEKYTSWGIIMGEHFSLSLSLSLSPRNPQHGREQSGWYEVRRSWDISADST